MPLHPHLPLTLLTTASLLIALTGCGQSAAMNAQALTASGEAVDIATADAMGLSRFGGDYDLCRIYAREAWHFELPADVSGTCPEPPHGQHRRLKRPTRQALPTAMPTRES